MSKIKLFTHGADLDGVGCAILAYLVFGKENVDVEYCDYNDVDEKVEAFMEQEGLYRSYDFVYITDISVSNKVAAFIDSLSAGHYNVNLLDHHATALRLNQYPLWACVRVVDLDTGLKTCGTEMFYKCLECRGYFEKYYLHQKKRIVQFVETVRDYDTWRWKELGDAGLICKQVNDLFGIYGRETFIDWVMGEIRGHSICKFPTFDEIDHALLHMKQEEINRYVEQKDKQLVVLPDSFGYFYGVVFAEQYSSELGNRLCEMHPELDYVALIDISGRKVSYRTVRDDLDLGGEIAHSYGGGGHKKAAGSTFDVSVIRDLVVREVFS